MPLQSVKPHCLLLFNQHTYCCLQITFACHAKTSISLSDPVSSNNSNDLKQYELTTTKLNGRWLTDHHFIQISHKKNPNELQL